MVSTGQYFPRRLAPSRAHYGDTPFVQGAARLVGVTPVDVRIDRDESQYEQHDASEDLYKEDPHFGRH